MSVSILSESCIYLCLVFTGIVQVPLQVCTYTLYNHLTYCASTFTDMFVLRFPFRHIVMYTKTSSFACFNFLFTALYINASKTFITFKEELTLQPCVLLTRVC